MAHAGGPWLFDLDDMEVRGQYGRVASIQPRMDAIHNGRLISAAPDLLAILKEMVEVVEWAERRKHPGWDGSVSESSTIGRARLAIAKSES